MTTSNARLLSLGAAFLAFPLVAASPALPETFDLAAIDACLAAQAEAMHPAGLSVALVKDGELVLARGYGSRAPELPVETNTLFAIGSVTKQFTCASVLLLAEDGKLSVHDPVAKYYPHLTRAEDITLVDLMRHTSGYSDYYPLDFVDRRMQTAIDPDELLRRYAGGPLDFEPGTKWSYSNTGYILLGRVVEKVSGENFGDFLNRRILKPLGLKNTFYELDPKDSRIARGYVTFALGPLEPNSPEASGWIGAAGGIYSTPSDLAAWNGALISGGVLRPESYALMTSPGQLKGGKLTDYGCGLAVRVQEGRPVLSHSGAVSGFNAWNAVIPSLRCSLSMTCSKEGGLGALPPKILALLLREPETLSEIPEIKGPAALEKVKSLFRSYQQGRVDRTQLSEEFNHFLTKERLAGAAQRLKPFGSPRQAEVLRRYERGGMEVSVIRLAFRKGTLRVLMYRMPDGSIEQFFVSEE